MAEEERSTSTTVFTIWGLAGATVLVAATTMDDAIWLIPYICSSTLSWDIRIKHMLFFVATLIFLAFLCCIVANSFTAFIVKKDDEYNADVLLGTIAALLCWIIAVTLYVKKLLKKKKRQRQQLENEQQQEQQQQQQPPCTRNQSQEKSDYGAIAAAAGEEDDPEEAEGGVVTNGDNHDNPATSISSSSSPQPSRVNNNNRFFDPWTVMSMTFLGALDEISYFPALIMGHVFTSCELILGTAIAACLICLIISTTFLLAPCRPIMEWLDTIPLYAIVSVFAVVLTIGVVVDILHNDDTHDNDNNDGQQ